MRGILKGDHQCRFRRECQNEVPAENFGSICHSEISC